MLLFLLVFAFFEILFAAFYFALLYMIFKYIIKMQDQNKRKVFFFFFFSLRDRVTSPDKRASINVQE